MAHADAVGRGGPTRLPLRFASGTRRRPPSPKCACSRDVGKDPYAHLGEVAKPVGVAHAHCNSDTGGDESEHGTVELGITRVIDGRGSFMRRLSLAIVMISILSTGCSSLIPATAIPAAGPAPTPTAVYPGLSISLERGPCITGCAVYRVMVDAYGNVSYEGLYGVAVQGKRSAKITLQQVGELVQAIDQAHVLALPDTYGSINPSVTLVITLHGQSKHFSHVYGSLECREDLYQDGAPPALCALEHKIEAVVNVEQWVKP